MDRLVEELLRMVGQAWGNLLILRRCLADRAPCADWPADCLCYVRDACATLATVIEAMVSRRIS